MSRFISKSRAEGKTEVLINTDYITSAVHYDDTYTIYYYGGSTEITKQEWHNLLKALEVVQL